MKALVLSGGKGTRLRPITHTTAKQLVPVANKPILHYCLDNILKAGISDIGIIISPDTGDIVKSSVQEWLDKNNAKITFIMQDQPLGLAHAVKISQEYLGEDQFVMYLGDNLIKEDLTSLVERFNKDESDSLILLKEVENPKMFGVAVVENSKIIDLEEKPENPKSNLALVGVYLFNKNIHTAINNIKPSKRGELEITEAIKYLLDNSYSVNHHILDGWWLDTGKKDDLLVANRIVLDEYVSRQMNGKICPATRIEGRVQIDEGSMLQNCIVRGPVMIGKNCSISNSYIGPFTSIADNVVIEDSEIEYSVIMQSSRVFKIKGRIAESLIGSEVIIECSDDIMRTHKLLVGDHSNVVLS